MIETLSVYVRSELHSYTDCLRPLCHMNTHMTGSVETESTPQITSQIISENIYPGNLLNDATHPAFSTNHLTDNNKQNFH